MQTIGERLEEARKRKGISIREAAEATKIRGDYLQKFESNQFDFNLAELYVRGFLRSYATFLKLPADKIVNDYNGLGLSQKPRTPSREIYGRMDLSVSTSDGGPSAKEAETPAGENPGQTRRQPGPFARTGSSLPPERTIDPNLVIKAGLILGGVVAAALVVWAITAMFSGGSTAPSSSGQQQAIQPATPAPQNQITLIANVDTEVQVRQWILDPSDPNRNRGSDGPEIISRRPLPRGQTLSLPVGTYHVMPTVQGSMSFEVGGKRYDPPPHPAGFTIN